MNNKEFISELASRMGYTTRDTSSVMNAFVAEMVDHLEEDDLSLIHI